MIPVISHEIDLIINFRKPSIIFLIIVWKSFLTNSPIIVDATEVGAIKYVITTAIRIADNPTIIIVLNKLKNHFIQNPPVPAGIIP